jgi:MFS family permease
MRYLSGQPERLPTHTTILTNRSALSSWLGSRPVSNAIFTSLVAFLTYACVFSYRKTFTVATFDGIRIGVFSYQTLLIISQVVGYMISKFYGIVFISAMRRSRRWVTVSIMIGVSWACLLLFAVTPDLLGLLWFFINGFMLGFLWGVVFSYVEGRRSTDLTGSVMAVSFIFAGGFSRSVGKWLMMEYGVAEKWMPFMTGAVFAVPLAVFLWLMEQIPPPDAADEAARARRIPMQPADRKAFMKTLGTGIALVTFTYIFLTILRDIRDNYMANMWRELGYGDNYGIFTRTETITSVIVLAMMGMLVFVKRNMLAFRLVHGAIIAGFVTGGVASALFLTGRLSGPLWMQLTGLGLYMAYIPFYSIFFERLIASFRMAANVGFLMYITDAFGYLGSVSLMIVKETMRFNITWSDYYAWGVLAFSVVGFVTMAVSLGWFGRKHRTMFPVD